MENYLVNPMNPFDTLKFAPRTERVWRDGKSGRFGKLAGHARKVAKIRTKKRKAASAKRFKSVIGIVKKEKHMNPLMLINKRRKAARKSVRKVKVFTLNKRRKAPRRSAKRAVALMNPRRKMRRSVRRFRRNPMLPKMLGKGLVGEAGKLVILSASMFAGYRLGTWAMDQVSAKVPMFNQPVVRALVHVVLGFGAYKLASRVKQIPAPMATAIGAAVMMPGIITAYNMVAAKTGLAAPAAAPQQVSYAPEETSAYVPEGTGAYIPPGIGYGEGY